jgi:Ulp1 family protease
MMKITGADKPFEMHGLNIQLDAFYSLSPGQDVEDPVINAYGALLNKVHDGVGVCLNNGLSAYLLTEPKAAATAFMISWANPVVDLLKKRSIRYVLLPVNVNSNHWICIVIDRESNTISEKDSLKKTTTRGTALMKSVQTWYEAVCTSENLPYTPLKVEVGLNPQQNNTIDCGVFTMMAMERFAHNRALDYSQTDIPRERILIAKRLFAGKFEGEVIDIEPEGVEPESTDSDGILDPVANHLSLEDQYGIITRGGGRKVTGIEYVLYPDDFKCLAPGEWLTGVVIRAYGKMLNERHMSALILSADIYTWLVDLEQVSGRKKTADEEKLMRRVCKDKNDYAGLTQAFRERKTLCMPCHVEGNHWSVTVIRWNNEGLVIRSIDSLRYNAAAMMRRIFNWYKQVCKHLKIAAPKRFVADAAGFGPQQRNGVDCGVFTILAMDAIARDKGLTYTQAGIAHARMLITLRLYLHDIQYGV